MTDMPRLSRRQFLQFSGIAVLGQALGFDIPESSHFGRAFAATPIYHTPDGKVSRHLWPDSVTPLLSATESWYQVAAGYVKRTDLQPITYDPTGQQPALIQPNTWATVNAPSASIRAWCAADAPLVTHIGHGGVLMITDYLPGDPAWYGVGYSAGEIIGWSQAVQWRQAKLQANPTNPLDIVVKQRVMTIYADGKAIAQTSVATSASTLPGGSYQITPGLPGSPQAGYQGTPWLLYWGNQFTLSGVYWHNRFGSVVNGPTIQTTPIMAQWLYTHLSPNSRLIIRQ